MKRIIIQYIPFTLFVLSAFALKATAQQDSVLRQEVEVIKAYRPSISDAYKINDIPVIKEEPFQKPTFDYNIYSQPVFSTFSVSDLQAAKTADRPKQDPGYGMVQLGVGNYNKPYLNFFFNNNKTKNTLFGIHVKHLSSQGKVKLAGGDKVKAPFSDNYAEIFMKRFYRNSTLDVNVSFDRDGFNFYGFPNDSLPDVLTEDNQTINYWNSKQVFTKGAIQLKLKNTSVSKSSFKFGFDLDYHYFGTKTKQTEHYANFMAHLNKPVNDLEVLLDAGVNFNHTDGIFNTTTQLEGIRQQMWVLFNPAVKLGNKKANIQIGAKTYVIIDSDEDTRISATPNILANIIPIEGMLSFFAGIDGKLENNHYSKIAYENPFVDPLHDVKNSLHQFRFFGGINGKLSSKTNYKITADYSMIQDKPLYFLEQYVIPVVNEIPNPSVANNHFQVLYDDINILRFNAEIYHTASERLNLLLAADYYVYELKEQTEAWNMPDFKAKLSVEYKVTEQLQLSTEVFVVGERKSLIVDYNEFLFAPWSSTRGSSINKSYTMDMIIDLNVRGTYYIKNNFSLFAQLNNFGFQNYEHWLGYPVQSMNFLAGISFSF